jgi:phosphoserine phosphatase RsbU/P
MEIASNIQQSIMARDLPTFSYARLMARSVPCTEVGGDFYDVIPLEDDNGFVAIVADVSGKGMSAALLASIIQGMMYAQLRSGASLVDTLDSVNSFLCSRVSGRKYVTVAAVHYRPDGAITVVNGGHIQPFLVSEDGAIEPILDGDVPVGLLPNATFHHITASMPPNSRLVLLSDGITESENCNGVEFGATELQRDLGATDPIQAIFTSLHRFCEGATALDDRTILVIDRIA